MRSKKKVIHRFHARHARIMLINTGALARCLRAWRRPSRFKGFSRSVTTVEYVFSTSECREAYGVRAACCRFRQSRLLGNLRNVRKRQQAARTPYASRHSDALNTYTVVTVLAHGAAGTPG